MAVLNEMTLDHRRAEELGVSDTALGLLEDGAVMAAGHGQRHQRADT